MLSTRSAPAHRLRTALVALVAAVASIVPLVASPSPVGAATLSTADFAGRGWGHGRGMSQYGAQGYATLHGWSTDQILDHYYGGTRAGSIATTAGIPIQDPNRIRIRLMGLDDEPGLLVGGSSASTLSIVEPGNPAIPSEAKAVRMLRSGDNWAIAWATSCAGPWNELGESAGRTVTIRDTPGTNGLFACRPSGVKSYYSGWLRAQITDVGTRTINVTNIEEYLRGVVPREMPASWHPEALKAQAVAARSYAMAGDTRHDDGNVVYADTCDTTTCQVYKGRYEQQPGQAKVAMTHPSTDAAIAATAGVVREFISSGTIARTEFSSTSGGWTAGGTFPPVEDLGDVISPLHTWTARDVPLAPLASLGTGNITGISVTQRNGLGADGGRVLEVRIDFDGQSAPVFVSGNTVRSRLGLRSDWFTITDVPPPLPPSGFYDVPESSIYEAAVTWAAGEGITGGCGDGTRFCPGHDVTRAQAATFLWRHAGEPPATSQQFSDVRSGVYYFDAVRWVRDEDITLGCTATEFCPNGSATRAHLVTFLWRHAGEPEVTGGHGFADIPAGSYYEEAVDWAVQQDITTGTSATEFSPNASVTRGQTMLFLHRYLGD